MGSYNLISAVKAEETRVVKGTNADSFATKNGWAAKTLPILEAYAAKEKTILSNEKLSPSGKRDALIQLGTATAPQFKWLSNVVEGLEKSDKDYKAKFFKVKSTLTDAVERMTIHNYVWGKVDSMDLAGRIQRFDQAAQEDDIEILVAMTTNPMGSMIPKEMEERSLGARAQRWFPQPFENYQQNTYLLEVAKTYRNWIARWLVVEVGVEVQVIRQSFGDAIADILVTQQQTGIRTPEEKEEPVGV